MFAKNINIISSFFQYILCINLFTFLMELMYKIIFSSKKKKKVTTSNEKYAKNYKNKTHPSHFNSFFFFQQNKQIFIFCFDYMYVYISFSVVHFMADDNPVFLSLMKRVIGLTYILFLDYIALLMYSVLSANYITLYNIITHFT